MKKFLAFVLMLVFGSVALAQTDNEFGGWLGIFSKASLDPLEASLWQEFQLRHSFDKSDTKQLLFRFGPLWNWDENKEYGLLYAFIQTGVNKEHRLTQQLVIKWNSFSTRLRLEERILERQSGVNFRFRSLFRYDWKLAKQNLVLWNETFVFLNHPDWVGPYLVDRNRFFAGIRFKFFSFSVETGYLNQFAPGARQDLSEHLIVLYLFY